MHKIDCFGDICPVPILKMKRELAQLEVGNSFQMVVDHSCVITSMEDHLKNTTHSYIVEEVLNGVWEITITKEM